MILGFPSFLSIEALLVPGASGRPGLSGKINTPSTPPSVHQDRFGGESFPRVGTVLFVRVCFVPAPLRMASAFPSSEIMGVFQAVW